MNIFSPIFSHSTESWKFCIDLYVTKVTLGLIQRRNSTVSEKVRGMTEWWLIDFSYAKGLSTLFLPTSEFWQV